MGWILWLAGPVVLTVLAAVWAWWRARPARTPSTAQAMQAHSDYLDALVQTARGRQRTPPAGPPAE